MLTVEGLVRTVMAANDRVIGLGGKTHPDHIARITADLESRREEVARLAEVFAGIDGTAT